MKMDLVTITDLWPVAFGMLLALVLILVMARTAVAAFHASAKPHEKSKKEPADKKKKKTPPEDDDNSHWNIPPHIE